MSNQPTPEQAAFIEAVGTTRDSLRLDAVAGSGKTTTLTLAARRLGVGQRAIALAFNKSIAEELQKKFPPHVQCKTLNGIGHQVWMKAHGKKSLDARKLGDIVSKWCEANLEPKDKEQMWGQIRTISQMAKSQGLIPMAWQQRTEIPSRPFNSEAFESLCEQAEVKPNNQLAEAVANVLLTSISEAFTNRIDFDDQIYMSTYFASADNWPQFDLVMVDEAQDLSQTQHDMIERLGAKSRLIVVGDAHQAIYGWRGASCKSLDELEARFNLKRMPLTVSFRCPEAVIREAQKLVPHIRHHKPGGEVHHWWHLHRRDAEAIGVGTGPIEHDLEPGWFTDDFETASVILCRNNAPLIRMGFAMVSHGKPVFFANRDVGAGLKKIVEGLDSSVPFQKGLDEWFQDEMESLRNKSRYAQMEVVEDKYQALCAIAGATAEVTGSAVIRGIDRLFLREPSPGAIELSTIHKSKGKEWQTVYILNEHLIPGKWIAEAAAKGVPGSDDLLQQEDNLKYVAITRALNRLVFVEMDKKVEVYSKKSWAEREAEIEVTEENPND